MSIEADLRTFLVADGGVNGIVSTRIYGTDVKPQNGGQPAIVFNRVGTEWLPLQPGGQSTFIRAEFEIDCWANDYDVAHNLRETTLAVLQNYRGTMGSTAVDRAYITSGPVDVYESDIQQYRSSFGVQIAYNG